MTASESDTKDYDEVLYYLIILIDANGCQKYFIIIMYAVRACLEYYLDWARIGGAAWVLIEIDL